MNNILQSARVKVGKGRVAEDELGVPEDRIAAKDS